jgi:hypothetical protein
LGVLGIAVQETRMALNSVLSRACEVRAVEKKLLNQYKVRKVV